MGFKEVQAKIAAKQGVSSDRAGAMLAAGTRSTMKKHGISTKHGIPKGVFQKHSFKGRRIGNYNPE